MCRYLWVVMPASLAEVLLREGVLTSAELERVRAEQALRNCSFQEALTRLGLVAPEAIGGILSRYYGVPFVRLEDVEISPDAARSVPAELARHHGVLPLALADSTLTLAMIDPTNLAAIDEVRFLTGMTVKPVVCLEEAARAAIARLYGDADAHDELERLMADLGVESVSFQLTPEPSEPEAESSAEAEEAPIIRLVNLILSEAIRRNASDVHIEPMEKQLRIRFRIDGVLHTVMNPPLRLKDAIVSRLKVMARLDISEKRLPQDGRIKTRHSRNGVSRTIDLRVSTIPTLYGEKVVLRLLDQDNLRLDMTQLGMEPESLAAFKRAIARPYGMVLVTGPTGSGKTSTLYSAIAQLNTGERNIVTAEDPVEFQIPGINQVQIKEQIGLTFAAALRSFLRQDPDIILVGEIRDHETAEIAIKAALTGHLVLSTLHTNDAPSAVTRLIDMGVEPFLVASAVHLICAQRLVRRICADCCEPVRLSVPALLGAGLGTGSHGRPEEFEQRMFWMQLLEAGFTEQEAETLTLLRGRGCASCNQTGYRGRIGLFEVMEITPEIREMILARASVFELRRKALEQGMLTLRRSGLQKVLAGITTLEEVLRETTL